jgi:hypothetical protein
MSKKATYFILTIPFNEFVPYLPANTSYIKGQLECSESDSAIRGPNSSYLYACHGPGYLHWQLVVAFPVSVRLAAVVKIFGRWHAEPTRSKAALEYVWKDETGVKGTQFELGVLAVRKDITIDWDAIKSAAKCGELDSIPSHVYVRCYGALSRIAADNLEPAAFERTVVCYIGSTGTGKSRRAWGEAGMDAFPKDPRTKFWCGYRDHKHVIIDEFRGGIDISHILRWLDRYPVVIEVKGGARVLKAEKIWITSNIHPRSWYPTLDKQTLDALLRRMELVEF